MQNNPKSHNNMQTTEINALLLKTFQELWANLQRQYKVLADTTLLAAIDKLLAFKDNPQGLLENEIDSVFIEFETTELEYIKELLVANF